MATPMLTCSCENWTIKDVIKKKDLKKIEAIRTQLIIYNMA